MPDNNGTNIIPLFAFVPATLVNYEFISRYAHIKEENPPPHSRTSGTDQHIREVNEGFS